MMPMPRAIRVGISSCLLGEKVRYDGDDRRDASLIEALGRFVEWVSVCPEFEIGLGVPREPIQIVRAADRVHLVGVTSGEDHTAAMRSYARRRLDALAALDLSGYVFKKNSPSCGLRGVPVWNPDGTVAQQAAGVFAAALVERFRDLPVAEEADIADPRERQQFLDRVLAYARRRLALIRDP